LKVISICNQKGGAGKTSVSTNLAVCLASLDKNKKILVIDTDPQGHSTFILYKDPNEIDPDSNIVQIFENRDYDERNLIKTTRFTNLEILPSNILLFRAQPNLYKVKNGVWRLRNYLKIFNRFYDYVLIDTPPELGVFLLNALYASDFVLIPTDLEILSVRGIRDLFNTIRNVKKHKKEASESLEILGILPNKLNKRVKTHKEMMELLEKSFGERFLKDQQIGTNAKLSRATLAGKTIMEYDKNARSYKQYLNLAEWLKEKIGNE